MYAQVSACVRGASQVDGVTPVRLDTEIFRRVFAVSVTTLAAPTLTPAHFAPAR